MGIVGVYSVEFMISMFEPFSGSNFPVSAVCQMDPTKSHSFPQKLKF